MTLKVSSNRLFIYDVRLKLADSQSFVNMTRFMIAKLSQRYPELRKAY